MRRGAVLPRVADDRGPLTVTAGLHPAAEGWDIVLGELRGSFLHMARDFYFLG